MIPLLTLCAIYAPEGRRASWFALMASLMNLALVAGALQTKYLNMALVVDRGNYANLPELLMTAMAIGFIAPLAAYCCSATASTGVRHPPDSSAGGIDKTPSFAAPEI